MAIDLMDCFSISTTVHVAVVEKRLNLGWFSINGEHGHIAKAGYKKFFKRKRVTQAFRNIQGFYKYYQTDRYVFQDGGTTGQSAVLRALQEDTRNIYGASIVFGKRRFIRENYFLDFYSGFGASVYVINVHKISYGTSSTWYENFYPDNTYEKHVMPFLQIDFGLNFGFGRK